MAKRSDVQPLPFPASAEEAVIRYASDDRHAVVGEGVASFESRWSNGGADAVHVYQDPSGLRGVAIAPDARTALEVTTVMAEGLDFTSCIRMPRDWLRERCGPPALISSSSFHASSGAF